MDVFKIAEEINAHRFEISKAGISVVMSVSDNNANNEQMCIFMAGKYLGLIRGLAANFIGLRKSFMREFSKEEWDEIWQKTLSEQAINLMINEKLKDDEE